MLKRGSKFGRWDGNRTRWMALGESYSLYSLEHWKPTQEASFLCIAPWAGWYTKYRGANMGQPHNHYRFYPNSSLECEDFHSNLPVFTHYWCHVGHWVSIEIAWSLYVFICSVFFNAYVNLHSTSTSHFMVTSHHNMIQKWPWEAAGIEEYSPSLRTVDYAVDCVETTWVWKGNEMTRECTVNIVFLINPYYMWWAHVSRNSCCM